MAPCRTATRPSAPPGPLPRPVDFIPLLKGKPWPIAPNRPPERAAPGRPPVVASPAPSAASRSGPTSVGLPASGRPPTSALGVREAREARDAREPGRVSARSAKGSQARSLAALGLRQAEARGPDRRRPARQQTASRTGPSEHRSPPRPHRQRRDRAAASPAGWQARPSAENQTNPRKGARTRR